MTAMTCTMRTGRAAAALALALAGLVACRAPAPGTPATTPDVQVVFARGELPRTDPASPLWASAPTHVEAMLLQDQAEPKLAAASVPALDVKALHDGAWIVFRLEWPDATADDLAAPARFADAVAVQFPLAPGGDVPDAAMGQKERPVRIHQWKAAWQRRLESPHDAVAALYPNAAPDHYPYEHAKSDADRATLTTLYAPSRGADNPVTLGRKDSPTQDLEAEGFGSLAALPQQVSLGKGVWKDGRWAVAIARPLDGDGGSLLPGGRTYVAFAVWDGAAGNSGGRKMRSGWVPLAIGARP